MSAPSAPTTDVPPPPASARAPADAAAPTSTAAVDSTPATAPRAESTPARPVTLGPVTFDTGDDAMRYFGALRNELTLDQNMNEYEAATTEALLRLGHEDAAKKFGSGLRAFQVRNHPVHNTRCFMIVRTDGTMEDFSYRKCAARLFPGYDPATFREKTGDARSGGGRGGRGGGGRGGGRGARIRLHGETDDVPQRELHRLLQGSPARSGAGGALERQRGHGAAAGRMV